MNISGPKVFGLFEKRIEGDDALLELAKRRFSEAHLGMECYAGSTDDIARYRAFRYGSDVPMVFHLPRWIDLMNGDHERLVKDFLSSAAGIAYGVIVHDQHALVEAPAEYGHVLTRLSRLIASTNESPYLFVEYAAMLDPDRFAAFFGSLGQMQGVGPCIDIGHVGSKVTADLFSLMHRGSAVHRLRPSDPGLIGRVDAVVSAVQGALPKVVSMVEVLAGSKRPLHFHLHDGHPLSTVSPYGVTDHLSFLREVPIPFEYGGKRSLPLMFGAAGLEEIVSTALRKADRSALSFSLEIHPAGERSPLDDVEGLFAHWSEMAHAEQMNHWLSELISNYDLLMAIMDRTGTS